MKQKIKNAVLFACAHPAFVSGIVLAILNPFLFGGSGWRAVVRLFLFVNVPAALFLYWECVVRAEGRDEE